MNKRTFLIVVEDLLADTEDCLPTTESFVTGVREGLLDAELKLHEIREIPEPFDLTKL